MYDLDLFLFPVFFPLLPLLPPARNKKTTLATPVLMQKLCEISVSRGIPLVNTQR